MVLLLSTRNLYYYYFHVLNLATQVKPGAYCESGRVLFRWLSKYMAEHIEQQASVMSPAGEDIRLEYLYSSSNAFCQRNVLYGHGK